MKLPIMVDVKSSNIESIGFGPGLFVRFKGGGLYHYPDAPQTVYDHLAMVEGIGQSVGRAFQTHVRGTYKHVQVHDAKSHSG